MAKRNIDRIYIIGNGNQAPYGIGEIIDIVPASHIHKIRKILNCYYNPPIMRLNSKNGSKVAIEYDSYTSKPIGYIKYQ